MPLLSCLAPRLLAALKDTEADVRVRAAEALGKIGDDRAVQALVDALRDDGATVRQSAATALERIRLQPAKDEDAITFWLVKLRSEATHDVHAEAARALDELDWHPRQDEDGVFYWIAKRDEDACVAIGSVAVTPLITALAQADVRSVRQLAAVALGRIGDTRAVEPLTDALDDGHRHVRVDAAKALGRLGDGSAIGALHDLATREGEPVIVRSAATDALLELGWKPAPWETVV